MSGNRHYVGFWKIIFKTKLFLDYPQFRSGLDQRRKYFLLDTGFMKKIFVKQSVSQIHHLSGRRISDLSDGVPSQDISDIVRNHHNHACLLEKFPVFTVKLIQCIEILELNTGLFIDFLLRNSCRQFRYGIPCPSVTIGNGITQLSAVRPDQNVVNCPGINS